MVLRWLAGPRPHPVPLGAGERVLAGAGGAGGERLVAPPWGLWVIEAQDPPVRTFWDEIDHVVWTGRELLVEALIGDPWARRFALGEPGQLPQVVRERVTAS